MPLQATSGAASYDGFGGGVAAVPQYIEDVFSTWLYKGTGSAQTITNGIDLSTKGGLVWIKQRDGSYNQNHSLTDTARGAGFFLASDTTTQQVNSSTQAVSAFTTSGFSLTGNDNQVNGTYPSPISYASWTFRKQPKFFDIVTWTGDGTNRAIPHNLGSVPGCMIVKCTNAAYGWMVYHRSTGATKFLYLDTTEAAITNSTAWNDTEPTSTVFTVGNAPLGNESGKTYVAYLFAHNAGGFGLAGTDNVISCGSFTTDGSAYANVNLGYEPQWVLQKRTDSTQNWYLTDNMRGSATLGGQCAQLFPSSAAVESSGTGGAHPTATGFESTGLAVSGTFIYIAIRRGPMKVPTTGTSVFSANLETSGANPQTLTTGFPVDLSISTTTTGGTDRQFIDKLRGPTLRLLANSTGGEGVTSGLSFQNNTAIVDSGLLVQNGAIFWNLRRAPSFFDEVCYVGNSTAGRTVTHNLAAVPELMIVVARDVGTNWNVYSSALANTQYLSLNTTDAVTTATNRWNSTTPTSSVFTLGTNVAVNSSTVNYVAYLFATCAGVSKVGSYTGTGATQTINCGFTAGARFILIKRTDDVGDWYVWDSVRGIVAGNDPYLLLNTSAAAVTNTDYIDTASTGFEISSTAPAAINASGGTFIFLAIA